MITKFLSAFLFSLVVCASAVAADTTTAENDGKLRSENATQGRLGVSVSPVPEALASHLPEILGNERGILVSDVIEGSPADKVGLKKFDILVRYGDQDLYSPEQLVKRVRNDRPESTVEIHYVHGGRLHTVDVKLGEEKAKEPVHSKWPDFGSTFKFAWPPLRPSFWNAAHDESKVGTQWTTFESLSMNKQADGSYSVRIAYKDKSGKSFEREFKGTRQEIRDAVSADSDLPESRKNQLMRTLDDRGGASLTEGDAPYGFSWNSPLFQWPNVDF